MNFHHFERPRWVFFDLDDTLWDFSRNSLVSLHYVFSSFSSLSSRFASFDEFADVYHFHNSALWNDFARGAVTSPFLRTERWRRTVFPESSPECPPAECGAIDSAYLSKLASLPHLKKGALPVLEKLSRHFMCAALSNGFAETQYLKLYNSGLWKHITRIIISDEAGCNKPDPRIFLHAVRETGATGLPVMVGDNPSTDILGALATGWEAVWYNPDGKPSPFSEDSLRGRGTDPALFLGEIRRLEELPSLLQAPEVYL